jgi:hypothetical protein
MGAPHPEGELPVGGRVGDRGDEQCGEVRPARGHRRAQPQVDQRVGKRGADADDQEDADLHAQAAAGCLGAGPAETLADLAEGQGAADQGASEARHAQEVVQGGAHDVDAAVRVVGPVDRHLVDPQPGPFGDHEQLGVEEPGVVLDERQQLPGGVAPDGLEAALGVAEPRPKRPAQDQVVAARDEFPLRPSLHPRGRCEPRPDGQVGVPAHERRDQRQQGGQVRGQVHVHVDQHVAVRGTPHPLECPAPTPLREVDDVDLGVGVAEASGDQPRLVGAGVVGDGHPEVPGHRPQVDQDPFDRRGELGLLVVDRDDHVEHGGGSLRRGATGRRHRLRQLAHRTPPERS